MRRLYLPGPPAKQVRTGDCTEGGTVRRHGRQLQREPDPGDTGQPMCGSASQRGRRPRQDGRWVVFQAGDIREWRGRDVVDTDDHKIGTLEAIYVDTTTDHPAFAT